MEHPLRKKLKGESDSPAALQATSDFYGKAEQEVQWARMEYGISVDGTNVPPPVASFAAMQLPPEMIS